MGGSASLNVMSGRISPSTTPGIVVSDSRAGFDFTYMCCEALLVSYMYVVIGFHKEIAVWVVFVVAWVNDVVSDRVDAKGVVCEDVELGESR